MDVDPNYDPSDFLKLPGNRQDNHDMGMVKQEHHPEMQQYDIQQEELQQQEYEQQEYQQQDYQHQMDGVNIEVKLMLVARLGISSSIRLCSSLDSKVMRVKTAVSQI